jgi:hypothetical protein
LLAANRADIFWQAHKEAEEGNDIYSAEFKDLFEKMMALTQTTDPNSKKFLLIHGCKENSLQRHKY